MGMQQANFRKVSAGVQNETCCGNKMRQRFSGGILGANSLSRLRMDGPGRACWRGRGESVTRWRLAATRAGTRKPVAAARPPSPTDGATTPVYYENRGNLAPPTRPESGAELSLILFPPAVSFCSRPNSTCICMHLHYPLRMWTWALPPCLTVAAGETPALLCESVLGTRHRLWAAGPQATRLADRRWRMANPISAGILARGQRISPGMPRA